MVVNIDGSFLKNRLETGYSTHFVGNSRLRQRSIVRQNATMTKEVLKFSSFAVFVVYLIKCNFIIFETSGQLAILGKHFHGANICVLSFFILWYNLDSTYAYGSPSSTNQWMNDSKDIYQPSIYSWTYSLRIRLSGPCTTWAITNSMYNMCSLNMHNGHLDHLP